MKEHLATIACVSASRPRTGGATCRLKAMSQSPAQLVEHAANVLRPVRIRVLQLDPRQLSEQLRCSRTKSNAILEVGEAIAVGEEFRGEQDLAAEHRKAQRSSWKQWAQPRLPPRAQRPRQR